MGIVVRRRDSMHNPQQQKFELSVMALHCSGSDRSQWEHLSTRFGPFVTLSRPNLAGPEAVAAGWTMMTYALAEEAKPLIAKLRQTPGPVHLVGHSYGGAVALHIAASHPDLVASLCLYEPTLFGLLNRSAPEDATLFREIRILAITIRDAIADGSPEFAAQIFTDFWGGLGSWQALRRERQYALTDWISKCPLDFGALLFEQCAKFQYMNHPTTLIVGSQTHPHTRRIGELLASELSDARVSVIEGAGHLGPFVFRDKVTDSIQEHLTWLGAIESHHSAAITDL